MKVDSRLKRLREAMDEELGPQGVGVFYGLPDGELAERNEETGEWEVVSQEEIESRDLEAVVSLNSPVPGCNVGESWEKLVEEHGGWVFASMSASEGAEGRAEGLDAGRDGANSNFGDAP